jgi:hypothetical protein
MCLMCEEEDRYFLYLEQLERAQKAARGETSPPNPNWLWPTFAQTPTAPELPIEPRVERKSTFVCDTPDE